MTSVSPLSFQMLNRQELSVFRPFVHYTQGFTLAAGDRFGGFQIHLDADPHISLDMTGDLGFNFLLFFFALVENLFFPLHIHSELIQMPFFTNHQLVLGFDFFDVKQEGFHLGRKDVDTADDQHIVCSSGQLIHFQKRSATGAFFSSQPRDIIGTITDHRDPLFGDRRNHQFTLFSISKGLTTDRIDNLRDKMILPDMQATLGLNAFDADSRPQNL